PQGTGGGPAGGCWACQGPVSKNAIGSISFTKSVLRSRSCRPLLTIGLRGRETQTYQFRTVASRNLHDNKLASRDHICHRQYALIPRQSHLINGLARLFVQSAEARSGRAFAGEQKRLCDH